MSTDTDVTESPDTTEATELSSATAATEPPPIAELRERQDKELRLKYLQQKLSKLGIFHGEMFACFRDLTQALESEADEKERSLTWLMPKHYWPAEDFKKERELIKQSIQAARAKLQNCIVTRNTVRECMDSCSTDREEVGLVRGNTMRECEDAIHHASQTLANEQNRLKSLLEKIPVDPVKFYTAVKPVVSEYVELLEWRADQNLAMAEHGVFDWPN